jgi:hypothetical protein
MKTQLSILMLLASFIVEAQVPFVADWEGAPNQNKTKFTNQKNDNIEIINNLYKAFSAGDIPTVLRSMDEQIN